MGFTFAGEPLFVGNFIHAKEANEWYTKMNQEVAKFSKKYWITPKSPKTFYKKFLSNHLYKTYYAWVNKCLNKHNRDFTREFNKTERKYKQLKKAWTPAEKVTLKRAS